MGLAQAHVAAVEQFDNALDRVGVISTVLNLGTGEGVSVRELLSTFEKVFGRAVPTVDAPPRPGDSVGAFANVDKARDVLGWTSKLASPAASSRHLPGQPDVGMFSAMTSNIDLLKASQRH